MLTKFTKALIAALVLTGVSLSIATTASAAPFSYQGGYMHPRHDPTDTNGD